MKEFTYGDLEPDTEGVHSFVDMGVALPAIDGVDENQALNPFSPEYDNRGVLEIIIGEEEATFTEDVEEVSADPLRTRFRNVLSAVRSDYRESENKITSIALGAGTFATQAIDRARMSLVVIPSVAVNVLEETQNSPLVGLAAGGLFAAWQGGLGEVLTQATKRYPKTLDSVNREFPTFVEVLSDSLPGLSVSERQTLSEDSSVESFKKEPSLIRRLGQKASLHLRRGVTSSGIGNTAFVGTASAQGMSTNEVRKVNISTTVDGGLVVGGVAGLAAEAILRLSESGHYETAQNIQDVISNSRFWYGVAAASVLSTFLQNRRLKKKLLTSQREAEAEMHTEDEPMPDSLPEAPQNT